MQVRGIPLTTFASLIGLRPGIGRQVRHIFLCVCDHWEPKWKNADRAIQRQRVKRWRKGYPAVVRDIGDCRGRPPQHTFFYPAEEYESEYLDALAALRSEGFGDVEIHLHHDSDTSAGVRDTLESFRDTLVERHGLLRRSDGKIAYGFIHGNWALDNSRPDGRWCGVNDELTILRETGCYADFTMPSAPDACQTSTINSIYYATDDPTRAKSHDRGTSARVGQKAPANSLLMIQGPLALDWSSRKWGILPRVENGDLTGSRPATWRRLRLWCASGVRVLGREDWLFVKLHTHGAQEANSAMLLGAPMQRFHCELAEQSRDARWRYWYVTAREMAGLVNQAEQGFYDPAFDQLG